MITQSFRNQIGLEIIKGEMLKPQRMMTHQSQNISGMTHTCVLDDNRLKIQALSSIRVFALRWRWKHTNQDRLNWLKVKHWMSSESNTEYVHDKIAGQECIQRTPLGESGQQDQDLCFGRIFCVMAYPLEPKALYQNIQFHNASKRIKWLEMSSNQS